MTKFYCFALLFLAFFSVSLQAKDATAASVYFDPAKVDLKALLPDPPANDSATTKQEIELILQKQKARTPDDVLRIKREVHLDIFLFDTVLGPTFQNEDVPVTAAFFKKIDDTIRPVVMSAKKYWDRPRPPKLDKRVKPPIDLPKNASYPSGHSTFGNLNALVLADLAPDLRDPLLTRGAQIGDDRIIAGVHYPSDVAAGKKLADDLYALLKASPQYQADFAKAKAEMDTIRGKK
jgi:acid phosphatase (class A)